jgi:hypothetical protein
MRAKFTRTTIRLARILMSSRLSTFQLLLWSIAVIGCKGQSESQPQPQALPSERVAATQISSAKTVERDLPLQTHMVITTSAVCRVAPDSSAVVDYSYKVGDVVGATKTAQENGKLWYFDAWRIRGVAPTCWIDASLTTEFSAANPEPALLAVVDHLLQNPDKAQFEDYVAVENLLLGPTYSPVVKSSGLLQFRKLSLIDQAISRDDARDAAFDEDPLKEAWVRSQGNLVIYDRPDGRWYVLPERYWDLYEKYKQEPWAEDLAWTAAQAIVPSDECYADCILNKVSRTFAKYWQIFPTGHNVDQALTASNTMAKYAAELACSSDDTDFSVPRPLVEEIRTSLANVRDTGKGELLDDLAQIERKCYPNQPRQ